MSSIFISSFAVVGVFTTLIIFLVAVSVLLDNRLDDDDDWY